MLAFKSDVSHWRKKDELVGVSLRYVALLYTTILTSADELLRTVREPAFNLTP
jgi:hypothetical protein